MGDAGRKKQVQMGGIPAAPGIAIGEVRLFGNDDLIPDERSVPTDKVPEEVDKFHEALEKTKKEMIEIENRISDEMGVEHGRIFSAHLMVLEDKVLVDEVESLARKKKKNIEFVFYTVLNKYIQTLADANDEYLRDRVADISDVGKRVLRNLSGRDKEEFSFLQKKSVVVSYDLSPSDTAGMHREKVLGFATDIGGRTSHTAIMAKSLQIPAVVGLESVTDLVSNGDDIIIDGIHGIVIINPTKRFLKKYLKEQKKYKNLEHELIETRALPSETLDGKKVVIAGNIELPEDVAGVISHGGEGIGLYRTEYFYMNRADLPNEEEQFKAYRSVAQRIKPNYVVVRTLDLGGDKFLSQLDVPREMNPFMGWRAIRFCLARPDVFKVHLRAILRASAYGKVKLMYPMISGIEELRQANKMLEEVKNDLRIDGIDFDDDMPVGAMIEVPSAAVMSDSLAEETDFFSIGTNDLIQYSLAVDRVNEKIAYLYDPAHPAVLKLVKQIIDNGHKAGIPVGLCGEMAGDITLTILLLGLGLDEFSVSPIAIPEIKKIIRSVKYEDAKKIAQKACTFDTGKEVQFYLKEKLREVTPAIVAELLD